jgi:hypothetical protein
MRKLCAREKHTKRGTLPLAAFVALLVAMAAGLAAPSVGYAGEISDPAATDYTTISSQSEDEDLIAQYPELATTILTQMVYRKDDVIDVSSYNINTPKGPSLRRTQRNLYVYHCLATFLLSACTSFRCMAIGLVPFGHPRRAPLAWI